MNISPTPKRYTSSSSKYNYDEDDDFNMRYNNRNIFNRQPRNNGYQDSRVRDPNVQGVTILPEEYRMNSKMIGEILQEVKDLKNKLNAKDEELIRLTSITQTLRNKVTKYKNENERLQKVLDSYNYNKHNQQEPKYFNNQESPNILHHQYENIEIPKRRSPLQNEYREPVAQESYSETLNRIYESLENLKKTQPALPRESQPQPSNTNNSSWSFQPSEEDILVKESVELKNLEKEVEAVEKRLSIRHENEIRKTSLQLKLAALNDKLDMYSNPHQSFREHDTQTHHSSSVHDICKECNKNHSMHSLSTEDLKTKLSSDLSANSMLQTPTPIKR
ncbi:hypothetical protein TPHA_0N01340 [Tetrapisispora phaffii CBS 4417]|uniref:Spindle pole body component SPC42 n=1 Tax=Tetrapisispora phaffii (strain ATCC 24235 / CBS 4417 / NBRC 1672 / NRRL Y-8282 / UCD 70-5) TaxID=1071381 RepID=G8C187_TETPH|nr:hypothetical protein TPHA_0N01340 [Tetrapisispora phaffii CBS 4417]CCE65915.1 hypothetical protein TPHA_0N01340 [Tetrapisispora phaffii CBS 4417]